MAGTIKPMPSLSGPAHAALGRPGSLALRASSDDGASSEPLQGATPASESEGRKAVDGPSDAGPLELNGVRIVPARIQPPPLRDEPLTRDRLLDWLHAKVHH